MKLSDNLKRIRKENNLSQEQLAEKLGVSRQAVSKWESEQSFPEMDKLLLICKTFNYNIDELMNENVKEVDENKQSKINSNRYISDFFEFITKTVEMLGSMTVKQRIKCLLEQVIVIVFLFAVYGIIGGICGGIIGIGNYRYSVLKDILIIVYNIISFIIGITVFLHIFKIRYLDYYEIVKTDKKEKDNEENQNIETNNKELDKKEKIFIKKEKEKIIIRDPEHSESKFLTGIVKIILLCIKFCVVFMGIGFAISFVSLIMLLVLSFLIVKTGMFFIGVLLCIIAGIAMNFVVLELLYDFIVSKNPKKTRMWLTFISSLVVLGIGIGILLIGMTQFDYESNDFSVGDVYYIENIDSKVSNINNGYLWRGPIEGIETQDDKIKVVVSHSKYCTTSISYDANRKVYVYCNEQDDKQMEFIREFIDGLNNHKIKQYNNGGIMKVCIYASRENLDLLRNSNYNIIK